MTSDSPFYANMTATERQAKIQEMVQQTKRMGEPLLRALNKIRPGIFEFKDILPPNVIDDSDIVNTLGNYFETICDRGLRDIILTSMNESVVNYDGRPFARVFDSPVGFANPRWQIANLLANGKALYIEEWAAKRVVDSSLGQDREMLCYVVAQVLPASKATEVLKSVFEHLPMHAAGAMGIYGGSEELAFLKSQLPKYHGQIAKTIEAKGIRRIDKRNK